MKQTVSLNDFRNAFDNMGGGYRFSYEGLEALYNDFIAYEEDTGSEMELDVIAICCDYTEYSDLEEFQSNYDSEYETIEDIEERTHIIPVGSDGFIIQNF